MPSERTPLTSGDTAPQYSFQSGLPGRKLRLRQFQCCLAGVCLLLVIVAAVALTSWKMNGPDDVETLRVEDAMAAGTAALEQRDEFELRMASLQSSNPSYKHQKAVATSEQADSLARIGYASYRAAQRLANNKHNGSHPMKEVCGIAKHLKDVMWQRGVRCTGPSVVCSKDAYRSADGRCNNLHRGAEMRGAAFTRFRRMLPADYADGVGAPRASSHDKMLPTATQVSSFIHRPVSNSDPNFTVMLAVWGQFMDHDITATALSRGAAGAPIACCGRPPLHPECFPVMDGDRCSEFVRSAPAPSPSCCLGPREQLNQASTYIDGSVVYGSDERTILALRSMAGGKLKMLRLDDGRELLPPSQDPRDGCNRDEMNRQGKYCFLSGDARANENIHLTSMHLLWARQHNRLADELRIQNPSWNDEQLFQEARHIVAAQIQHVTYAEFLPAVLGESIVRQRGLELAMDGHYDGYNETIDATVANEFAAAAFRFAHSIIPGLMKLLANDTSSPEYVQMHEMLFNPYRLYNPGELDRMLRGAMQTHIEAADPYFTDELKRHLFERDGDANGTSSGRSGRGCGAGLDLVALNIQRGRDHGLPGYTAWRRACDLPGVKSFSDLATDVDPDTLLRIAELYGHLDDVDLYTGALSERPLDGGLLGATANCIVSDQFVRLRSGDRFWYENPGVLTTQQLTEIRRTSLASIICDNSDKIENVSPHVMRRAADGNSAVSCAEVPRPNLDRWAQ